MFVVLGLPFPQVYLSVGGGGGGGGGQQASSLSSTHKLWNFHRYSLVDHKFRMYIPEAVEEFPSVHVRVLGEIWGRCAGPPACPGPVEVGD